MKRRKNFTGTCLLYFFFLVPKQYATEIDQQCLNWSDISIVTKKKPRFKMILPQTVTAPYDLYDFSLHNRQKESMPEACLFDWNLPHSRTRTHRKGFTLLRSKMIAKTKPEI